MTHVAVMPHHHTPFQAATGGETCTTVKHEVHVGPFYDYTTSTTNCVPNVTAHAAMTHTPNHLPTGTIVEYPMGSAIGPIRHGVAYPALSAARVGIPQLHGSGGSGGGGGSVSIPVHLDGGTTITPSITGHYGHNGPTLDSSGITIQHGPVDVGVHGNTHGGTIDLKFDF